MRGAEVMNQPYRIVFEWSRRTDWFAHVERRYRLRYRQTIMYRPRRRVVSGDYEGSCAHQSEHMGRAELDETVELVEAGVIVLALPVVVAGSSSIASVSLSREAILRLRGGGGSNCSLLTRAGPRKRITPINTQSRHYSLWQSGSLTRPRPPAGRCDPP